MKQMEDDYMLEDDALCMFDEPNWLGDENIEFYWEQVAHNLNPNKQAVDVLFVPPAVVMLAHFLSPSELQDPVSRACLFNFVEM
jgi:hypothetical protein